MQTALSQTALWAGQVVTYTVTLTCRPTVDVLQGDLDADKLALERPAGRWADARSPRRKRRQHAVRRRVPVDDLRAGRGSRWHRRLDGALRDWRRRRRERTGTGAARFPARRWRGEARCPMSPRRSICAAIAPSSRYLAGGARRGRSRSDSSVTSVFAAGSLARHARRGGAAARQTAQARRDAGARFTQHAERAWRRGRHRRRRRASARTKRSTPRVRRHAGEVTALPAAALTPAEFRRAWPNGDRAFSTEELSRILDECQRARYHAARTAARCQQTFARRSSGRAAVWRAAAR